MGQMRRTLCRSASSVPTQYRERHYILVRNQQLKFQMFLVFTLCQLVNNYHYWKGVYCLQKNVISKTTGMFISTAMVTSNLAS
jgi:hypothetical protein